MRRLIVCLSGCLLLAPPACSSDAEPAAGVTGSPAGEPVAAPTGAAAEVQDVPTELVPVIERLPGHDALVAGPGEEQLALTAVASDGEVVIAAGTLADEDRSGSEPVLLRTTDGRVWQRVDLGDSLPDGGRLLAATATAGGFVVAGDRHGGDAGPVAMRSADGATWEAVDLELPHRGEDAQPFQVAALAAAGDRVVVLGWAVDYEGEDGVLRADTVELGLSVSNDGGASWQAAAPPGAEDRAESVPAVPGDAPPVLVAHDTGILLGTGPLGPAGPTTTLWSQASGGDWIRLGGTAELFENEPLELLHSTGDTLLAFTRSGDDLTAWRSGNAGVTFERLDAGPDVFGGDGTQAVDAAVTLPDGSTVVAGRSMADPHPLQRLSELELWVTPDLVEWQRPLTDPALHSRGAQRAAGVVALADEVLVVGTDERRATSEELEGSAYDPEAAGPPRLPPLARDGAVWAVTLEEREQVPAAAEVTALDVRGFAGDVTVSDLVAHGGGLVAAGWIEEDGVARAAVWTSPDGRDWVEVASHALAEPAGQRIHALTATADGGLVAVGRAVNGDDTYLGVWASPDGRAWARGELEFESSTGLGVAETAYGLVVVGTADASYPDVYPQARIWLSADGGQSWTAVDTAADPFGQHNVEVLDDIAASGDGRIVAVGHTGEIEDPELLSFRPAPLVIESADGLTWSALAPPAGPPDSARALAAAFDGDLVVLGWTSTVDGDDVTGHLSGVFREGPDGWAELGPRVRHRASVSAAAPSPAGLVVTGTWGRRGGTDALIGLLRRDEVTFVTEGLVAAGDQQAVGAAPLGDAVVVLGLDTSGAEPAVLGWQVGPAEE